MKTFFIVALSGFLSLGAIAQDAAGGDSIPTVQYEAPVIYQAPVLYQMPVVYYAPVYYLSNPPCEPQPEPTAANCAPSTVVVIGGREGAHSYSHYGSCGSTLIQFGAQQACAYGYQFNLPR